jgi:hypothetical protein
MERGIVEAAVVLVVGVRAAVAVAELRPRLPGGQVWYGGTDCWPVVAVIVHDVLWGLALLGIIAGGVGWAAVRIPVPTGAGPAVTVVAVGLALAASSLVLHRRRGIGVGSTARPRRAVAVPRATLRSRLLDAAEREGFRAGSRWVDRQLEGCRRTCGATPEQLLPAVWSAVRQRLREITGVSRTETALLLVRAQEMADDVSPPEERMRALLHLLHERSGRRCVAGALEQVRRTPIRHTPR